MYKKFLIVASKNDKAGMGIVKQLMQSYHSSENYDIDLVEGETIFTESLNQEKINQYDFIIFASKHKSEKNEKSLSVHSAGNPRNAEFGGESKKFCPSSALFQKELFKKLNANTKDLNHYKITMECTHHGPSINKPCVYIEIGSSEIEWTDRRAAFAVAKTISETIKEFQPDKYCEIAIGIGGPHYCPGFNKIQLKSNIAVSHIIPQYALPISKEIIREAVEKTDEAIDFALIDWKGVGTSEQRQEMINLLEDLHIRYKKTSEV